jgi:hypothetical protein
MSDPIDAMTARELKRVRAAISAARMSTFDAAISSTAGSERTRRALRLYVWNSKIAAAFMPPLNLCEVAIRNALSEATSAQYGSRWPWAQSFEKALADPAAGYSPRSDLIAARRGKSSTGRVIPELKFVFWQRLLTSRFDNAIWDHQLLAVLPQAQETSVPALRSHVFDDLDRIRLLRNRIAHHEPIIARDLAADLRAIEDLVALRCAQTAQLLAHLSGDVSSLLKQRPG